MLRETSQSLPKTKLKPNLLSAVCDSPIRRMKKYASSARIRAARAVSPQRRIRSGIRPAAGRPDAGRPAEAAVVAPASTGDSLRHRRPVAGQLRQLRGVLRLQRRGQRRVRELARARAERLLTGTE